MVGKGGETIPKPNSDYIRRRDQKFDLKDYVLEDANPKSPIIFYHHKDKPEDRLVKIVDRIIKVHEKPPTNSEMLPYWYDWKEVEKIAMLDEETLKVMHRCAEAYQKGQPLIIEGPPAKTKTFGIWLFSCAIGAPYVRVSFMPGTKDQVIKGGRTSGKQYEERMDIKEYLEKDYFANHPNPEARKYIQALRNKKEPISQIEKLALEKFIGVSFYKIVDFPWRDSQTATFVKKGGIIAYDEPNIVENESVLDAALPLMETVSTQWNIQGRPDGAIPISKDFAMIWAQNPRSVKGRKLLSEPVLSRAEMMTLKESQEIDLENLLTFFITGNNPEAKFQVIDEKGLHKNISFKGKQNLETPYRGVLESMPQLGNVIKAITKVHATVNTWIEGGDIGKEKRKGGNYVFDMRKIRSVLDSMISSLSGGLAEIDKSGNLKQVDDWEKILKHALHKAYVTGLRGEDKQRVLDMIDKQPLWTKLKGAKADLSKFVSIEGKGHESVVRLANQFDRIDLSKYIPEEEHESNNSPIRFYHNKENPNDRVVWMLGIVNRVQEPPSDPDLKRKYWQDWKDVEKGIMLDKTTVLLMAELADRYRRGQPLILEGPPARTKTFAIWAFARAIGAMYGRIQFQPSSKDRMITGGPVGGSSNEPLCKKEEYLNASFLLEGTPEKRYAQNLLNKGIEKVTDDEMNILANMTGISYFSNIRFPWEDSETALLVENGGIVAFDEPNIADDPAVLDATLPLLEFGLTKWNISGRPQGPIKVHKNFRMFWAQNTRETKGRKPLSDAILSRTDMSTTEKITIEEIKALYQFFITGNNPEFEIDGVKYKGKQNIQTDYRQIQENPQIKQLGTKLSRVINDLAGLHMKIVGYIEDNTIGKERKIGGNYEFDMRKIAGILNAIIASGEGGMVDVTGNPVTDMGVIIKNALEQVYLGVRDEDKPIIQKEIDNSKIWKLLANPTSQGPEWMDDSDGNLIAKSVGNDIFEVD